MTKQQRNLTIAFDVSCEFEEADLEQTIENDFFKYISQNDNDLSNAFLLPHTLFQLSYDVEELSDNLFRSDIQEKLCLLIAKEISTEAYIRWTFGQFSDAYSNGVSRISENIKTTLPDIRYLVEEKELDIFSEIDSLEFHQHENMYVISSNGEKHNVTYGFFENEKTADICIWVEKAMALATAKNIQIDTTTIELLENDEICTRSKSVR